MRSMVEGANSYAVIFIRPLHDYVGPLPRFAGEEPANLSPAVHARANARSRIALSSQHESAQREEVAREYPRA